MYKVARPSFSYLTSIRICFMYTIQFVVVLLCFFKFNAPKEFFVFCIDFLPLASSKQHPWFWRSTVPAHCSPGTCAQLESSCPQKDILSQDSAGAESQSPAWRISLHAGWCQCLVSSPADGPVDQLWMSSSPLKC